MSATPTVVVIDDDLSVRRSLDRLLVSAGYVVVACSSAHEFPRAREPARPACLVTDVRMPGMTGLDLLEDDPRAGPRPADDPEQRRRRRRHVGAGSARAARSGFC